MACDACTKAFSSGLAVYQKRRPAGSCIRLARSKFDPLSRSPAKIAAQRDPKLQPSRKFLAYSSARGQLSEPHRV
jgi:hypothetical protein